MLCEALVDRNVPEENQVMLDKADTATKLRVNLTRAFGEWQKLDFARNSKAELARQCSSLAERPCSPQTVNGWFKTGRMDKIWLPVLEEILGSSLGFGGGKQLVLPEMNKKQAPKAWPYQKIDFGKLVGLRHDDQLRLEGAILQAAGQLRIDIERDDAGKRIAA